MPKPGGRGKLKGFGGPEIRGVCESEMDKPGEQLGRLSLHPDTRDAKRTFSVTFSPAIIKRIVMSTCRRVEHPPFCDTDEHSTHGF